MTALEDFENTLKEVVGARRLSASKMNTLTEIAMKSLEDDTKLVAILYRTHNSLPSSAKVSSLYAFDALARAARGLVNKRGLTGDVKSTKGNATTFLLKIEGVLDGLFRDMVSLDNPEAKDKTKKVHDIWVKSNTFPPAVLARLRDILSDVQKEIAVNPTPTHPPPTTQVPTVIATAQPATRAPDPVPNVQATLLALLGQAAQGQGQPPCQTPPNSDPQLQPQLALLQQLARTAKLVSGSTPPGHTPSLADHIPPPAVIPAQKPSPAQSGCLDTPGDGRYARNGYLDRARDQRDFRDERHSRGGGRGGFRGRGRWDDHHNHDRFRPRDRDRIPPGRPRRSRSRSPRRHEETRNVRPYSPPRRPLSDKDPGHRPQLSTPPTSTYGTDEFGRDIRASSASPSRSTSVEDTQALAPMDSSVDPTTGTAPDNRIPVSDQSPLVAASTTAQSAETHAPSQASQQQTGLDQFDLGTFDATAPSSWEGLGIMWQTTHGYPPSQEELMHFVMAKTMAVAGIADGGFDGTQGGQWQQGSREEYGSQQRGGWQGRGRGNYAGGYEGDHGNYRNGGATEPSDVIVLNGDEDDSAGKSGRMQRVGDKWMFVKDVESA